MTAQSASLLPSQLPIHFFTIVLNGEPFIRYHERMLDMLPIRWHWHIIEGVAELKHDSSWSVAAGGHIPHHMHKNGLSLDGTSKYLDNLSQRFPKNITIYRKPFNEFWDGKREMVNAPITNINEECLLWQIDSDELWSAQQIISVHHAFVENPGRTAALYWCWFFVGPEKVIVTRDNYGNYRNWLRTWRYEVGDQWASHSPPILVRRQGQGNESLPVDVATIAPFTPDEMESIGAVFQHYAYTTENQVAFKEHYYGYSGALAQWEKLQKHDGPGLLKEFLPWVPDNAAFDYIHKDLKKSMLARQISRKNNKWAFPDKRTCYEKFLSLMRRFRRK